MVAKPAKIDFLHLEKSDILSTGWDFEFEVKPWCKPGNQEVYSAFLISLLGKGTNCAIDYGSERGGECIVTGGTILAFGESDMVEEFSSNCTQCSVLYNIGTSVEADTIRVLDANSKEIMSYTPVCSYSSVAFSSPYLDVDKTYTIVYGDSSEELTLESVVMSVGNSGGMKFGNIGRKEQGLSPAHGGQSDSEHHALQNESMGTQSQKNGNSSFESRNSSDNRTDSQSDSMADFGDEISHEISTQPGRQEEVLSDFIFEEGTNSENGKTESSGFVSLEELDESIWILLGVSFLSLIVATIFVKKYRKN